jgi:ubiquinone/menaquinone biosynthesis C-methylase UbiE
VQHLSDMQTVQADFDRIALVVEDDNWNHNNHYHHALLKHMPTSCGNALEIGCGTGAFARLIAERAEHVLALDLAPQMI